MRYRQAWLFLSIIILSLPPSATAVPAVLSRKNAELYQQIFALQSEANWAASDQLIDQLTDDALFGYVMAERYLHPQYTPTTVEITEWQRRFGDLPLTLSGKAMPKPIEGYGDSNGLGRPIERRISASNWHGRENAGRIWQAYHEFLNAGDLEKAYRVLFSASAERLFKAQEMQIARWNLSQHFFVYGDDARAYHSASAIARMSGDNLPEVYWVAGISAWRMGMKDVAIRHFLKTAYAEKLSPWDRAAGAFWSFRYFYQKGQMDEAVAMLKLAASYPRTFYGILARTAMQQDLNLTLQPSRLGKEELKDPMLRRIGALAQLGKWKEVEWELRAQFPTATPDIQEKLMAIAGELGFPGLQMRMAREVATKTGAHHDAALYPVPHWKPEEFRVEPSLVYAIMRQESGFYPYAVSPKGASGLMQMMPETVRGLIGKKVTQDLLFHPQANIELAQAYLNHLSGKREIGKDVLLMLASYNAGPGRVVEWKKKIRYANDPLLFLESIPAYETRNYVEQVLANYWIYRAREGLSNESIITVLRGGWPTYELAEKPSYTVSALK